MCSKELGEKRVEDKSGIEDILDSLQSYWLSLTKKIETINAKLTVMPGARENFERNFFQFASWLNELEQNSNALTNNNLTSSSEYRRLLDKTKVYFFENFIYFIFWCGLNKFIIIIIILIFTLANYKGTRMPIQ